MTAQQFAPFDPDYPRCRDHRTAGPGNVPVGCPSCAEAARWVQDRNDRQLLASQALIRGCGMCDVVGGRWDPDTHVPVSPLTTCDHVTAHAEVVAGIRAAELEAEAARRAAGEQVGPAVSSVSGRARARELFKARPARRVPAQRGAAAARRSAASRPGLDGGVAARSRVVPPGDGPLVVDGVPVGPGEAARPNGCSNGDAASGVGAAGRETATASV